MLHSITIIASNPMELSRQSEILVDKGFSPFEEPWPLAGMLAQTWVIRVGVPSVAQHRGIHHDD